MDKSKDYTDFTAQVKGKLNKGIGPPPPPPPPPINPPTISGEPSDSSESRKSHDEWVRLLYTKYTERFINDNNKIWSIGTILIPLCLAGLLSIKDLNVYYTFLLGAGSVMLMSFWVLMAENHRAFQNRSQAVVEAIEQYIGFGLAGGAKLDSDESVKSPSRNVQSVRWQMYRAVIVIWSLAVIGKAVEPYSITMSPPKITLREEPLNKVSIKELGDTINVSLRK